MNILEKLFPYQKEGVNFLIKNNGRAILGDSQGLGKTIQTLAYLVYSKKEKNLIICPNSVKTNWEDEVKKWTNLKPLVINSKSKFTLEEYDKYNCFIINFEILKKFLLLLGSVRWDSCIVDEAQLIKNKDSIRSKATTEIARKIQSVILLSGTLVMNRSIELFVPLHIMNPVEWPNTIKDWFKFSVRYSAGHRGQYGWDTSGSSNIPELRQKISKYFLRRTKEEVLPDLPSKIHIDYPVELVGENKKNYNLALKSFVDYLKEVKKKTNYEIKRTMQAAKLSQLNELRQLVTNGKKEALEMLIDGLLDGGEKIIVFSVYNQTLVDLHEKYKNKSVLLTGSSSEDERKNAREQFQTNPEIKLFCGGLKSAGVGLNLTKATSVIFADYSWVPADHWQGEDRMCRIGNTAEKVSIYQLVALNTIDSYMKEIFNKKKELFEKLIEGKIKGGEEKRQLSIMKEIINKIEEDNIK